MKLEVIAGDIVQAEADAIVVNLFEGVDAPGGATGAVDKALDGAISSLIAAGEIKGKSNEVTVVHTLGRIPPKRVLIVGLGKQDKFKLDSVRAAVAVACKAARRAGARRVATILHGTGAGGISPADAAQAVTEGAMLGLYTFRVHMTTDPEFGEVEELLVVVRDESERAALQKAIEVGRVSAEATMLARNMVNQPANHMTPSDMAQAAQDVAEKHGLECTILEREDMERLGMGGLLGVSQGSLQPPKFIILKYVGADAAQKSMALVGKGLTFDSGGISIKPSEKMDEMKSDMSGGAAVIAALSAIGQLKPRMNVVGLIPASENLPSGSALKPGDVLKAMNGKTIEVANTDAEGRIILADALSYAGREGYSPVVDLATLTGACIVALGHVCTGAFASDQEFLDKVMKAGETAGEKMWQMPMFEEYKELNKSEVADVKNTGGRWGGAITAAQFLAEFVGDVPWVHLDIAGTAYTDKERSYYAKGGTGVGVRTMINLAQALAEG